MNRLKFLKSILFLLGILPGIGSCFAEGMRPLTSEEGRLLKELNRPRRIILAIGIDRFNDPFWSNLEFASDDAQKVYEVLRQEISVPFDSGELISSRTAIEGKVTRQDIMNAIQRLKVLNISEEDTVIVYLSTHGTIFLRKNQNLEAPNAYAPYFVASDSLHQDIQNTALSREELVDAFQSLKSQRKALIIASCHSGGGKAQITPEIKEALKHLKGESDSTWIPISGRGYSILAASSWSEPAVEDVKLRQDVYTHFLLEAMRQSKNQTLTLTQAHDYATRETVAYSGNRQHPTIQMDQSGGDPIVLSGSPKARGLAFLYSYMNSLRNYELRIGGLNKGMIGESNLMIPQGKHLLEIIDPTSKKVVVSRVIRLDSGKEYSISDLIQARKRWHLSLGVGADQLHGAALERSFAPHARSFSRLALRYDEGFGIWDVIVSGSYSSWQQETIHMNEQAFEQRRSSTRLFLGLGSREKIRFLPSGLSLVNEWGWSAGPGIMMLKRQILGENRASVESADAAVLLPAFMIGTNLNFHQTTTGFDFGVDAQYDAYRNSGQVQRVGNFAFLSQISAFFGVAF